MNEIIGSARTVKHLIVKKYAVDSYQREYKWEKKQLKDLIDDLEGKFGKDYDDKHELRDVKKYGQYFLGPMIISTEKEEQSNIVDGQQRLTTLTLMLIYLLHTIKEDGQRGELQNLICTHDYGEKSFNLNVPEWNECLHGLYDNQKFDVDDQPESIRNMVARYEQMQEALTFSPKKASLFAEWLIQKVCLVEIAAAASAGAYEIFETMNDRGLRLTPAEMLKGYLLMEIKNEKARQNANNIWKENIDLLIRKESVGNKSDMNKSADADFIKSWLRGQYTDKQTDKQTDFEKIGSEFHRWVRNNHKQLGLNAPEDFEKFITRDLVFYAGIYKKLRNAAEIFGKALDSGFQCVFYLAQHSFTLQYPLLLAPITPDDEEQEIKKKIRIVAAFLDILIHRRIGNNRQISERSMRDKISSLIPKIRNKKSEELSTILTDELKNQLEQDDLKKTLASDFWWNWQNRPVVHRILARITDYVETNTQQGQPANYDKYFGKKSFQIEHIWHANYEKVCSEEGINLNDLTEGDFEKYRDRIGALLLLPGSDNASYKDSPYTKKREYYRHQNILAASLHEKTYEAKPLLRKFKKESGLPLVPHDKFTVDNLFKRQELYCAIADKLWHSDRLAEAASSE